jgi:hypothetical protein
MSDSTQDQGMTINGGGFESRSSAVFAVTVAMITCSTVFVAARMVSRAGIVKKVLLDDYFMLVAWVSFVHLGFLQGLSLTKAPKAARIRLVVLNLLRHMGRPWSTRRRCA